MDGKTITRGLMRKAEIIHNEKNWAGRKENIGKHIRQELVVLDVPSNYLG